MKPRKQSAHNGPAVRFIVVSSCVAFSLSLALPFCTAQSLDSIEPSFQNNLGYQTPKGPYQEPVELGDLYHWGESNLVVEAKNFVRCTIIQRSATSSEEVHGWKRRSTFHLLNGSRNGHELSFGGGYRIDALCSDGTNMRYALVHSGDAFKLFELDGGNTRELEVPAPLRPSGGFCKICADENHVAVITPHNIWVLDKNKSSWQGYCVQMMRFEPQKAICKNGSLFIAFSAWGDEHGVYKVRMSDGAVELYSEPAMQVRDLDLDESGSLWVLLSSSSIQPKNPPLAEKIVVVDARNLHDSRAVVRETTNKRLGALRCSGRSMFVASADDGLSVYSEGTWKCLTSHWKATDPISGFALSQTEAVISTLGGKLYKCDLASGSVKEESPQIELTSKDLADDPEKQFIVLPQEVTAPPVNLQ